MFFYTHDLASGPNILQCGALIWLCAVTNLICEYLTQALKAVDPGSSGWLQELFYYQTIGNGFRGRRFQGQQ